MNMLSAPPRDHAREKQRGAALLYCLIALSILLVGSVASVRSFNSSLHNAGNIAFKRDMVNQGERAAVNVVALFSAGGALAAPGARSKSLPASNYSANSLPVNGKGIPLALIDDQQFRNVGLTSNDITDATSGTTVRYVVDRLCDASTSSASGEDGQCIYAPSAALPPQGGSQSNEALPSKPAPTYRLSVRVTGPRDTQVFLQSSFSQAE